jgi:dolichol-phosphate mannosyltransferase
MEETDAINLVSENVEITVILPTFNEARNIIPLINKIHTSLEGESKEILVVDDNSPDMTWEIAKGIKDKDVRVIRRTEDKGLVKSIKCGISNARGKYVTWMDADLSMPPEVIPRLVKELSEHDIAVGSRYIKGGKDLRPVIRKVTSRIFNIYANLILNFKVLDWTSGFIAARKKVFETLPLKDSIYGEYCVHFLYHADKNGFKIKEIPYSFVDRLEGESKTAAKISSLLKFGWIYGKRVLWLKFGNKKN